MLYGQVQWFRNNNASDEENLQPYPPKINIILERAFKDKKASVTFEMDKQNRRVIFKIMNEINHSKQDETVAVKRVEHGTFDLTYLVYLIKGDDFLCSKTLMCTLCDHSINEGVSNVFTIPWKLAFIAH